MTVMAPNIKVYFYSLCVMLNFVADVMNREQ